VLVLDGIFVVVEQSNSWRDLRGGVQNISTEGAGVCIYVMDDSLPLDCIEMAPAAHSWSRWIRMGFGVLYGCRSRMVIQ